MPDKFKNFLSIEYLFNHNALSVKLDKEKKEIEKTVDKIIDEENLEQMKIMLDNNYLLSWRQLKKIIFNKRKFINLIDNSKYIEIFNNELKNNFIEQINTLYSTRITNISNSYTAKASQRIEELFMMNHFLSDSNSYENKDKDYDYFKEGVKKINFSPKETQNLYEKLLSFKTKKGIDVEKVKGYYKSQIHYRYFWIIEEMFKIIKDEYNIVTKEKIEHLGEKYKVLNTESNDKIKEKIIQDMENSKTNFNIDDLNKETQKIYNEIKLMFIELQKNPMDKLQELEFKNILENQFPRTLSEYMVIPRRYREQLKNNKDSPDNILMQSLIQIKSKLDEMSDLLQEQNINKMKTTQKYLKNSFGY